MFENCSFFQRIKILLVQMIVLFHKEQLCQRENGGDDEQIAPVPGRVIRDGLMGISYHLITLKTFHKQSGL